MTCQLPGANGAGKTTLMRILTGRHRAADRRCERHQHFALDALDSYADTPDDPTRLVPNPAKAAAKTAVETARTSVHDAETAL